MERFVETYGDRIVGTLSGFGRVLFRGTLIGLAITGGMLRWLSAHEVVLKNFGAFAKMFSTHLKNHAEQFAAAAGRPFEYQADPSSISPRRRDPKKRWPNRIASATALRKAWVDVSRTGQ